MAFCEKDLQQVNQSVFVCFFPQADKNDVDQVIIFLRFVVAVEQVFFLQAVAIDIAVPAGRIHADPNGIYLLDTIIILAFKFPLFL